MLIEGDDDGIALGFLQSSLDLQLWEEEMKRSVEWKCLS